MPGNEKGERYENLIDQSIVPKTRCFFIHKNTACPADNKKGAADTGTCRINKDRQRKEQNMLEWLKEIPGDAYSEETDKRVSRKNGKNFVLHSDFNIIFLEKMFSIVDDYTPHHVCIMRI